MQAHVRHKTLDAMYGYGKLTPSAFADNMAIVTRMDPNMANLEDLPDHEPKETLAAVERVVDALGPQPSPKPQAPPDKVTPSKNKSSKRGSTATPTPSPQLPPQTVRIAGAKEPVAILAPDSWNIVGTTLDLPNEVWGESEGNSRCTVTHFIGRHEFPNGGSYTAYTVQIKGDDSHYAVRSSTIASHVSPELRKALRKKSQPTVLRQSSKR